jgi:hypothetical protein
MIIDKNRSVIGALIGAAVGIALLSFTMLLTAGGHGFYSPLIVCFPFPLLLLMPLLLLLPPDLDSLGMGAFFFVFACGLAHIQYPIYGAIIAGWPRHGLVQALLSLMGAHLIAAVLALAVAAARGLLP